MSVILESPHWAANTRLQSAANNNPPMRQGESNAVAVKLLQEALIQIGFPVEKGADGKFGPKTAGAVVAAEKHFGFTADAGVAGREVLGALDLSLRGWKPPVSTDWGGQLAKTIAPLAQLKVVAAQRALSDIRAMLSFGKFDFVTVDGVTLTALKTHFKLVSPGGTKLVIEEFITLATIDPLLNNYRGIHRTLGNPKMFRHTICTGGNTTDGISTAAECPLGGPIAFGPPFSNFTFDPFNISHNIAKTGRNSLAAMVIHEATHAIDSRSGFTESENLTTHISETEPVYETQPARFARHNPSAYATFAAHIHDKADRPRTQRFGLGGALNPNGGRPR